MQMCLCIPTSLLWMVAVAIGSHSHLACCFTLLPQQQRFSTTITRLCSYNLNTAFEWLAEQREEEDPRFYSSLDWMDLISSNDNNVPDDDDNDDTTIMPLYPIPATYLPSHTLHSLNNLEPRNIQMALDVSRNQRERCFCMVLCASDTGRIATVGTVMELVNTTVARCSSTDIQKMAVTCRPVATVDIRQIVNPEAAQLEARIRKSPKYLKARVQYRRESDEQVERTHLNRLEESIIHDYHAIRSLYLSGVQELPPYAMSNLESALPRWQQPQDTTMTSQIWYNRFEQWQTLCCTIREHYQMQLSSDRNELMVAAALKEKPRGVPLELPIHASQLSPVARRQLQELEVTVQTDFIQRRMDPCLDFQTLLALPTMKQKLEWFAHLLQRERISLEAKQRLQQQQEQSAGSSKPPTPELQQQPRKGAWFNDALWEDPPTTSKPSDDNVKGGTENLNKGAWFDDAAWDEHDTDDTATNSLERNYTQTVVA